MKDDDDAPKRTKVDTLQARHLGPLNLGDATATMQRIHETVPIKK